MKKLMIVGLLLTGSIGVVFAWGAWAHQRISHAAVFALPQEMRLFFYNHIDFITEEAVIPDIRRGTLNDKAEAARHFIDLEGFEDGNADHLPQTPKEATAKYDDKKFQDYGLLPWHIQDMMDKLTKAFKEKRKTEILFIAGDLGHYLADANMPLHTSLNYDGQLTGQKGIHSFWETQLPEKFGGDYLFNVPPAKYLDNITTATWDIIKHSHSLVDTLLAAEKNLKANYPKEKMYKTDTAGQLIKNSYQQPVYSYEYSKAFHDALNGMVEKQLRKSISDISNFWYTAWVNAGKPDLSTLDEEAVTKSNRKQYRKELKAFEKGKLLGFKMDTEN